MPARGAGRHGRARVGLMIRKCSGDLGPWGLGAGQCNFNSKIVLIATTGRPRGSQPAAALGLQP